MSHTSQKQKRNLFNVKSLPKQFVLVKREFKIHQPNVERQLKHCERAVKTISSIRHAFLNARRHKLAFEFERFVKSLIEYHHWRLSIHLHNVREQVKKEEAKGYKFNESGKPGIIEVNVKSAYFGRLIDMLVDMDEFIQHSSKLSLTGNYMANDIEALDGLVVGIIRDINTTMQSVKATLEKVHHVGFGPDKNDAEMPNFDLINEELNKFYIDQRQLFVEVKDKYESGDVSLVNKRNQSTNMITGSVKIKSKSKPPATVGGEVDAFDLAFNDSE